MSIAHSPTEKLEKHFDESQWNRFVNKIEKNFVLKTYPQFDPYFDFPRHKNRLKKLLDGSSGKSLSEHSFLPFVKIIVKTPRFRYQADENRNIFELTTKERESFYDFEIKPRPISFASHFDTYIYAYYSFVLTERYQDYIKKEGFDESVLAYRTDLNGRSNIQFAKEVFDQVKVLAEKGPCTAIALDIKGYFDSIDHHILKEKWCQLLNDKTLPIDHYKIYNSLTSYSYVNKDSILKHFNVNLKKRKRKKEYWQTLLDLIPDTLAGPTFTNKFNLLRSHDLVVKNKPKQQKDGALLSKGIPQGSSISAFLSNLYLIDFDKFLSDLSRKEGFVYRRYCDDLLIVCQSDKAKELNSKVLSEIKKYGLDIQDAKTELIEFMKNSKGNMRAFNRKKIGALDAVVTPENEERFYKNLQYLGFEFSGQKIYVRPGSLSRYFRKMKGRITKTIMMARGSKSKSNVLFKAQLYHRYTHLGKKNFLHYVYNASKKYYFNSKGIKKEGMNSLSIRKQLKSHFSILRRELDLSDKQLS